MQLAIHGATTMEATLPEDIAAAGETGFKALEIWASKMDAYLKQFKNRTPETAKAPVDSITGATKTCRAYVMIFTQLMQELQNLSESSKP